MERFDLATWELAPDSPDTLEGVASGRVRGSWLGKRDQEFLIRTARIAPDLPVRFARPVDSTEEGNWAFFMHGYPHSNLDDFHAHRLFHIPPTASLGRVFHLSFEPWGVLGRGLVVLDGQRQGHLRWMAPHRPDNFLEDVLFEFDARRVAKKQAIYWRRKLDAAFAQEGTGANFALRWIEMTRKQRLNLIFPLGRGTHEELVTAMRRLLLLDPNLNTHATQWRWNFDPFGFGGYKSFVEDGGSHCVVTPFLARWRIALLWWFKPTPQHQLVAKYPLTLDAAKNQSQISISITPPTHHGRLEAALELRDWARGKVPDELLETLL